MSWWSTWRRLRERGVLGMNRRNTECILDLNPRQQYPLVDGKRRMYDLCRALGVPTPSLFTIVPTHSALRRLTADLAKLTEFVIKPNRGSAGRGILIVKGREGEHFVRSNGERLRFSDVRQHVSNILSGLYSLGGQDDEALIQQRVTSHPAFEKICFQGISDIRVLSYKQVAVMAMLRLPTKLSGGRANLHQGGIGVGIDVATGVTHHAVFRNRLTQHHPDTGESVIGFTVPDWPQILEMAQKVSGALKLGYLGVDIVVDRDQGPLLLEVNARPGLAIQTANGQGLIPRLEEVERNLAKASARKTEPGDPPALGGNSKPIAQSSSGSSESSR